MPLKFALTFRYWPTRLHHYTTTPLHYYTHTDRNEMSSFFCWYLYPLIYPSYRCFFISIGVQVECRSSCAMFMNVFVFVWVCLCVYRCICVCDKFERFIPIWVVLFLLLCGCCFVLPQLISMILCWDKHNFFSNERTSARPYVRSCARFPRKPLKLRIFDLGLSKWLVIISST